MQGTLANRVAAPVRTVQPFSTTRPLGQRPSPAVRRTKKIHESRHVRMRAGTDDVGSCYGNALIDLAQEKDLLNEIHDNAETLMALWNEDESVRDFLTNPMVTTERKKEIVDEVAKKAEFSEFFVNFLYILIDQDRIVSAEAIFDSFEETYCSLTDTQVATIYSAVKLEQEQQFLVAKKLQELTGSKNIKLKTVIDEDIIAGFIVDYGSAQIDLSLKGSLENIAQELVAGSASLDLGSSSSSSSQNNNHVPPAEDGKSDADIEREVEEELSKAKETAMA